LPGAAIFLPDSANYLDTGGLDYCAEYDPAGIFCLLDRCRLTARTHDQKRRHMERFWRDFALRACAVNSFKPRVPINIASILITNPPRSPSGAHSKRSKSQHGFFNCAGCTKTIALHGHVKKKKHTRQSARFARGFVSLFAGNSYFALPHSQVLRRRAKPLKLRLQNGCFGDHIVLCAARATGADFLFHNSSAIAPRRGNRAAEPKSRSGHN